MADELHRQRINMHCFVEQRMALIAPNLVRILGAASAAMVGILTRTFLHYPLYPLLFQIVSQAGGLGPLSKEPACNLLVLGKQKKTLSGFRFDLADTYTLSSAELSHECLALPLYLPTPGSSITTRSFSP